MEEKKYPKVVKLDNGMYTFENPDGTRWKKKYFEAAPFREGFAVVKTKEENNVFYPAYTFVDENGNEWKEKFFSAYSFKNGLARVHVDTDNALTYVDKNQNVWIERFTSVPCEVSPGLMFATAGKDFLYFFDFDHNFYTEEQADILESIYKKSPERFLDLQTDDFKNEGFIKLACGALKGYLVKQVESKKEVDDDYVKYAAELLAACEEKIKTEKEKIAQSSKNKDVVLNLVENFGKELK